MRGLIGLLALMTGALAVAATATTSPSPFEGPTATLAGRGLTIGRDYHVNNPFNDIGVVIVTIGGVAGEPRFIGPCCGVDIPIPNDSSLVGLPYSVEVVTPSGRLVVDTGTVGS